MYSTVQYKEGPTRTTKPFNKADMEGESSDSLTPTTTTQNESTVNTEAENLDQKIMNQMDQIRKEIEESVPLLSNKDNMNTLSKEYPEDDAIYQDKIQALSLQYRWIRRTRRDGNCFYRAFGISLMEVLRKNSDQYDRYVYLFTCNLLSVAINCCTVYR